MRRVLDSVKDMPQKMLIHLVHVFMCCLQLHQQRAALTNKSYVEGAFLTTAALTEGSSNKQVLRRGRLPDYSCTDRGQL